MGKRRGEMKDMLVENTTAFLEFEIPTRGLIGYRNDHGHKKDKGLSTRSCWAIAKRQGTFLRVMAP